MERKLVTIREIAAVNPIPDADAIEVVTVDGWKVVSKKNEFKPGDLCLYFEIDSFLPIKPEYEFLRKSSYKKVIDGTEGFRLKTVKLRGQISQGLVMPISEDILKTLAPVASSDLRTLLDQDLTELFGVTKWEPPLSACLSGLVKGNFPSHTPKSGQERIQNLKYFFELYKDEEFEMSLKLDGSSCTMYLDREDVFGVCSRNLDLKPDESNSFWKQAYIHGVEDRLKIIHSVSGLNLSIQAELVGEGIQENHEKIKGQDLYVFNIWDQHLGRSLTPSERHATLDALNDLQVLGSKPLKHVPVIGYEKVFTKYQTLEALFEFVESLAGMNPGVILEGVVFKSVRPINGSIVSFKIVSNKYLLSKK